MNRPWRVRFIQSDSSVRVRLSNYLGSFVSVRNGLRMGFEFCVFGSGSVQFPSLNSFS